MSRLENFIETVMWAAIGYAAALLVTAGVVWIVVWAAIASALVLSRVAMWWMG